jgi:hypothetical protein
MPSPEINNLPDTAVLWMANLGQSTKFGAFKLQDPVELTPGQPAGVKWNISRKEVVDSKGNKIRLDFSVTVALDITVGSQMWLGTLEDWYGTGSGNVDNELCEVVTFSKTGDIKGRSWTRTVGLMRLHSKK